MLTMTSLGKEECAKAALRQRLALVAALGCGLLLCDRQAVTIDRTLGIANYVGDASFAFTGSMAAGMEQMDLFGCVFIGFVTALGGGTLRDLLLGRVPIFWATAWDEALLCVGVSTCAFFLWPLLAKRFQLTPEGELVFWTDTIGLAAFSVLGAQTAACLPNVRIHAGACAICGLSTACFGGLMRDILCQKAPRILYAWREMYATPAFLGALTCVLVTRLGTLERPLDVEGLLLGAWVTIELRVLAINRGARLPHFPKEVMVAANEEPEFTRGLLQRPVLQVKVASPSA
ncbi:unnamed protein product [Effrenium voratum]|nr:unnamed protein product [Effrenium voratum]